MTSVVDVKTALSAFKGCKKGGGACDSERAAVVKGLSAVVKAECAPYTEDFFSCFSHRYALSTCGDATVSKLLKCQDQLTKSVIA